MKRSWILLALGLLGLIITGCKDEKDKLNYIFPLQIGNYWTMLREISIEDEERTVYIDTLNIWVDQSTTTPQNESCYRIKYQSTDADPDNYGYEYLANRADGLYLVGYIHGGAGFIPWKAGTRLELTTGVFSRGLPQTKSKEIT